MFSPPRSNSPMPKPLTCSSHSESCHDWVAVSSKDYIEVIPEVAWNYIIAPLTCGNGVGHAFTHLSMPHLPPLPMWLGACDRLKPEGGGFLWPCLRHRKSNSRHPLFSTSCLNPWEAWEFVERQHSLPYLPRSQILCKHQWLICHLLLGGLC